MSTASILSTNTSAYISPYVAGGVGLREDAALAPARVTPVQAEDPSSKERDTYTRSPEAQRRAKEAQAATEKAPTSAEQTTQAGTNAPGQEELTRQEERQLTELKKRDAEVRRHEQAHLAAAGPHGIGPPKYEYQQGPDGKDYAIGGHVRIDTSPVKGDPEATLRKAQIIYRAALAPEEPSQQDRKIANKAKMMEAKARTDLRELEQAEEKAKQAEKEHHDVNRSVQASGAGGLSISAQSLAASPAERIGTERLEATPDSPVQAATITEGSPVELARLESRAPARLATRADQAAVTQFFEPKQSDTMMATATYAAVQAMPTQQSQSSFSMRV